MPHISATISNVTNVLRVAGLSARSKIPVCDVKNAPYLWLGLLFTLGSLSYSVIEIIIIFSYKINIRNDFLRQRRFWHKPFIRLRLRPRQSGVGRLCLAERSAIASTNHLLEWSHGWANKTKTRSLDYLWNNFCVVLSAHVWAYWTPTTLQANIDCARSAECGQAHFPVFWADCNEVTGVILQADNWKVAAAA